VIDGVTAGGVMSLTTTVMGSRTVGIKIGGKDIGGAIEVVGAVTKTL
jgi:hypothetical protein